MADYYTMDENRETHPATHEEWAAWYPTSQRIVALEVVGESRVSTIFLSIDHSYDGGPPLLFETLVFDGPLDGEMERCGTMDAALQQHAAMVRRVREAAKS